MKAKRMNIISAALAVGLVCISSVQNANAYFTTYVTAKGGYEVSWKHKEEIHEELKEWSKHITITSKEGSVPVYVRVKAFAGSNYELTYTGDQWTEKDGYYYYKSELQGGKTTETLLVDIKNIPKEPKDGMNFNVVVVYETIPVQYDKDGNMIAPQDADWTQSKTSQMTFGK